MTAYAFRPRGKTSLLFVRRLTRLTQQKGESFLIDDVEALEQAEAQINAFIDRRAKERVDANNLEAFWAEEDRRIRERRREANRKLWIDYYGSMHRVHLDIAEGHAKRRSQLMAEGGYELDETPDPEEVA